MKTEDLIAALSRDLEPAPRRPVAMRLALVVAGGAALGGLALSATIGVRPDIGVSLGPVLAKAGFSAALAAAALPLLLRLAQPGRPIGWRLGAVAVVLALSLAVAAIALMGEAPERRFEAWTGGGFPWCLVLIPTFATPAAAGLVLLLRDLAPTRLPLAGAALGAFAGGIGAAVYALYCPVDSVAFVATWYALAIAISAALGALVAARFLRW